MFTNIKEAAKMIKDNKVCVISGPTETFKHKFAEGILKQKGYSVLTLLPGYFGTELPNLYADSQYKGYSAIIINEINYLECLTEELLAFLKANDTYKVVLLCNQMVSIPKEVEEAIVHIPSTEISVDSEELKKAKDIVKDPFKFMKAYL